MDGHAPLISVLAPGTLRIKQDDTITVFVSGQGTLQVSASGVAILVERCEPVSEIDETRVRTELTEAQQVGEGADSADIAYLQRLLKAKERYG